jgi:hypothetical protein
MMSGLYGLGSSALLGGGGLTGLGTSISSGANWLSNLLGGNTGTTTYDGTSSTNVPMYVDPNVISGP